MSPSQGWRGLDAHLAGVPRVVPVLGSHPASLPDPGVIELGAGGLAELSKHTGVPPASQDGATAAMRTIVGLHPLAFSSCLGHLASCLAAS